jgi:hypothetical protein
MLKQTKRKWINAGMAIMLSTVSLWVVSAPQVTEAAQPESKASKNCIQYLSPIQPGAKFSIMGQLNCFATFSEAIFAVTGGKVRLGNSVTPAQLTQAMLAPSSNVIIGIDCGWYWSGTQCDPLNDRLVWYGASGCSPTIEYGVPTMPTGWNDRVDAAQAYSGCNQWNHFIDTYWSGTYVTCTCWGGMGALNRQTSSERWRYS